MGIVKYTKKNNFETKKKKLFFLSFASQNQVLLRKTKILD